MTEAAKQARREYQRRWRQRNKDKIKRNTAAYWERQALKAALLAESEQDAERCGV